jgi:IS1 family transposase
VPELDEAWSFVKRKSDREWLWVALCRRTRQVVASFSGDRSGGSCRALWELVPGEYKPSCVYTDFREAYGKVPGEQGVPHQAVGKDSGQASHTVRRCAGAVEQHAQATGRPLCAQDPFPLQVVRDALGVPEIVHLLL